MARNEIRPLVQSAAEWGDDVILHELLAPLLQFGVDDPIS